MNFNEQLAVDFQRYVVAFKELKNENEDYQVQLEKLHDQTQSTQNILQTSEQRGESDETFDQVLNQLNMELAEADEESRLLEQQLGIMEDKYADILMAKEEDKRNHEEAKEKIEEGKKFELEILIQEVEDFKMQLQNSSSEITSLQLDLVSKENQYIRIQKDIQKFEESCLSLESVKSDLETKISNFKQTCQEAFKELKNENEDYQVQLEKLHDQTQSTQNILQTSEQRGESDETFDQVLNQLNMELAEADGK
ncbi:early endosome antigen 1-like [Diaphorina citri]|uniref:Early endosome antigen 1-like n=1 Tax=Diaphorina citri TaxID=121845 RepID=A0A3Q0INA6_DIACI|nr:early endosome antigen 1-like [Diaphorina citri]